MKKLTDFSKLCIHSFTNKPWSLAECIANYERAGVAGISVWRDVVDAAGREEASRMLRDSSLEVVSLVRGGFFPATTDDARRKAIDANKECIDEAAAIGAPLVVLVCGATPDQTLEEDRKQIREGIEAVLPHAREAVVKLSIEPLHPMYADTRSAITTLKQANDIVEAVGDDHLGVTVDVYHLWWDDALEAEIQRSAPWLYSFHICDWKVPTENMLTDRGLMGEGCIDIRTIRGWVENAGFDGYNEVEIFSDRYWSMDQIEYLENIKQAYLEHS